MKLTRERLKQIIKEELADLEEIFPRGRREYDPGEHQPDPYRVPGQKGRDDTSQEIGKILAKYSQVSGDKEMADKITAVGDKKEDNLRLAASRLANIIRDGNATWNGPLLKGIKELNINNVDELLRVLGFNEEQKSTILKSYNNIVGQGIKENKKLTHNKLKQIVKEELEEVHHITLPSGGRDERPNYSAVPAAPDTQQNSATTQSKPEGAPPIAKEIFALARTATPEMVKVINTVGNLISNLESGEDTRFSLKRLKDILSNKP